MTLRDTPLQILAVVGSPSPGGRTLTAVRALLDGAERAGATCTTIELGAHSDWAAVQTAIERSDGILFASPVYGARSSALLKELLEHSARGMHGEADAPLQGKPTAVLLTGGSAHHFLAVDDLRSVLAGFFAAQVLSPGLYLHPAHYVSAVELTPEGQDLALLHGRAFAEFTEAVSTVTTIAQLRPLA